MEIQQLRHLIAAVECGNLLKAAAQCHISQSGLSRSILALEERLGLPLLIRMSKGVEPTAYGASVVQRARVILNEVDRSVRELRAIQACGVGDVVFGITQNYGFSHIPAILADFNAAYPNVRVTVATSGFVDLIAQVRDGALDFGFGLLGSMERQPDIIIETLRDHHARVVARADHALARKTGEVTPGELSSARWATLRSAGFQRNFVAYFSMHGLPPPVQCMTTDSIGMIHILAANTDMLAVLPPDMVRDDVEQGKLAILNCEAPAERTRVALVFRAAGLVSPQGAEIVALIRSRFGR